VQSSRFHDVRNNFIALGPFLASDSHKKNEKIIFMIKYAQKNLVALVNQHILTKFKK
jgi:hypothetical protein